MFSVLKKASTISMILGIISAIISIGLLIGLSQFYLALFSSFFLTLYLIIHLFTPAVLLIGLSIIFKVLYNDLSTQDIRNALNFKNLKSQ
jgi:uncharacterized membrane protein YkgB